MAEERKDIDLILDALGDATRRRIVDRLSGGPASVTALADPLNITLTAVAQHLRVLEQAKLVATEKVGRVRICQLEPTGFDTLEKWTQQRRSVWEQRLARLANLFPGQP